MIDRQAIELQLSKMADQIAELKRRIAKLEKENEDVRTEHVDGGARKGVELAERKHMVSDAAAD